MARARFQVLVFPYIVCGNDVRFALFRKSPEAKCRWQGVSGGGRDEEAPVEAAQRISFEKIGIMPDVPLTKLDAHMMIPVVDIGGFQRNSDMLLLPEYTFGVSVDQRSLTPAHWFAMITWQDIDSAMNMVGSDNGRVALWELHQRLRTQYAHYA